MSRSRDMRAIVGTIDWGVASLGLQMVGSVLIALDVFAMPVRETIHEVMKRGYYTWLGIGLLGLIVLSSLLPAGQSPVLILLWPFQLVLLQLGPSVPALSEALPAQHTNTLQSLTIAISGLVLETAESVPLLDWWVRVSAARQPAYGFVAVRRVVTSPVTLVGLPLMGVYLLVLYWWNRREDRRPYRAPLSEFLLADNNFATSRVNPLVSEALLSVAVPLSLAAILYALAVFPHMTAELFATIVIMILVAVPLFVPVVPLAVGYYLEDDGYVTSALRFAGFLLLAAGFITEFCHTLATA